MNLKAYSNALCTSEFELVAPQVQLMTSALNSPTFTTYQLNTSLFTGANLLSVYIAVQHIDPELGTYYDITRLDTANWSVNGSSIVTLTGVNVNLLSMYNRVIFVPRQSFNMCFAGITGTNVSSKRALWIKRSNQAYIYDNLSITSTSVLGISAEPISYQDISFTNGTGTGFVNLTTDYIGLKVNHNGSYVGVVTNVLGISSLVIDNNSYSTISPAQATLYKQGTLQFAADISGIPGTWQDILTLSPIDTDASVKLWVRNFQTITALPLNYPEASLRIFGTEFIA